MRGFDFLFGEPAIERGAKPRHDAILRYSGPRPAAFIKTRSEAVYRSGGLSEFSVPLLPWNSGRG